MKIGEKINRLILLRITRERINGRSPKGLFRCDCKDQTEKEIDVYSVTSGNTGSCGCIHKEMIAALANRTLLRHGMSKTPEHATWRRMLSRCYNKKLERYKNYGGRGIFVCDRWRDPDHGFENFYEDMGTRPSNKHSLDRIDNDGPYCKDNCRWATRKEQMNNQTTNRFISFNGERKTVSQWAEIIGISPDAMYERLNRGWTEEETIIIPIGMKRKGYWKKIRMEVSKD